MTELMLNVQMESLNGLDFSAHKKGVINESSEPALDLSTKKSPPASPASDRRSPLVSPQRTSPSLPESLEKNNNNESKYMNSYACIPHHSTPSIHLSQNHTHQYQLDDSSRFSSSSHERKSPSFESRPCMMTPPSETDLPASPKKDSILPMYEPMATESRSLNSNLNGYPMFNPLLPMPINQTGSQYSAPPQSAPHMPEVNVHETLQISTDETKKAPRPFKAYPKDPLSLSLGPNIIFDQEIKKSYSEFRNKMLDSVKKTNEGTNIKMRRTNKSPIMPTSSIDEKDSAYWERRRKNNEAAKRSRDARRAKEDEIAIRAAFLEREYMRLMYENKLLKDENHQFRCLLYGR